MALILILLFAVSPVFGADKPDYLESHLLEWIKPEKKPDDRTISFVVRRVSKEHLERIEDKTTRDKAKKCWKAFYGD